jgi:DNA-binding transcriptional LysR family regulator
MSLRRELRGRGIELALMRKAGLTSEEDLQFEMLSNETLHVVAGMQSPWARKRKIDLSDLMDEPWTLPPPDSFPGSLVTEIFRAGAVASCVGIRCDAISGISRVLGQAARSIG